VADVTAIVLQERVLSAPMPRFRFTPPPWPKGTAKLMLTDDRRWLDGVGVRYQVLKEWTVAEFCAEIRASFREDAEKREREKAS